MAGKPKTQSVKLPGQLPLTKREIQRKRRVEKLAAEWFALRSKERQRAIDQFPGAEVSAKTSNGFLYLSVVEGEPDRLYASLQMPNDEQHTVAAPLPPLEDLAKFIRALVIRYNHAVGQMNKTAAQCAMPNAATMAAGKAILEPPHDT